MKNDHFPGRWNTAKLGVTSILSIFSNKIQKSLCHIFISSIKNGKTQVLSECNVFSNDSEMLQFNIISSNFSIKSHKTKQDTISPYASIDRKSKMITLPKKAL